MTEFYKTKRLQKLQIFRKHNGKNEIFYSSVVDGDSVSVRRVCGSPVSTSSFKKRSKEAVQGSSAQHSRLLDVQTAYYESAEAEGGQ